MRLEFAKGRSFRHPPKVGNRQLRGTGGKPLASSQKVGLVWRQMHW